MENRDIFGVRITVEYINDFTCLYENMWVECSHSYLWYSANTHYICNYAEQKKWVMIGMEALDYWEMVLGSLQTFLKMISLFLFYVYDCFVCMHVCVPYTCLVPAEARVGR